MKNILEKTKSAAKDAVSTVTEKVISFKDNYIGDEQNEITEEFRDATTEKLREIVDNVNSSLELIRSSGYDFKGLGVSLGLSPSISLSFGFLKEVSEKVREEVMEKAQGKKTLKIILKLLFKAGDFYKSVRLGNYSLDTVNITLGLSLGMSLTMKKK